MCLKYFFGLATGLFSFIQTILHCGGENKTKFTDKRDPNYIFNSIFCLTIVAIFAGGTMSLALSSEEIRGRER